MMESTKSKQLLWDFLLKDHMVSWVNLIGIKRPFCETKSDFWYSEIFFSVHFGDISKGYPLEKCQNHHLLFEKLFHISKWPIKAFLKINFNLTLLYEKCLKYGSRCGPCLLSACAPRQLLVNQFFVFFPVFSEFKTKRNFEIPCQILKFRKKSKDGRDRRADGHAWRLARDWRAQMLNGGKFKRTKSHLKIEYVLVKILQWRDHWFILYYITKNN